MIIIKSKTILPKEKMKIMYRNFLEQKKLGLIFVDDSYEISVVEPSMEWIPIDADNMPKEGEEVLFTVAKGSWIHEPTVLSGWFVSKFQEFEIDDEGRSVKLEDVVAWMPFPAPYKPQEGEI